VTQRAAIDLELMRAALLLETDPAAAARRAQLILGDLPGHPEASLLLATACCRSGEPAAAVAALEALPNPHRDTPSIQLELGRAYAAAGLTAEALAACRRAVALEPGLADGWRDVAMLAFVVGDARAGDAAYAHYRRLTPDPPELHDATSALRDERLDTAESLLQRRLREVPHDVVALRLLADIANRREEFEAAERLLQRCLDLAPGDAAARYDLANLLYTQHRHAEALPLLERLLAAEPQRLEYLNLKAQTLRLIGGNDAAIALMEAAVAAHPEQESAWLLSGHLLREVGRQSRAIEMYRQALAVRPASGRAYWSLANLKTFRFTEEDLAAMRTQLAGGHLTGTELTQLEFALGKAHEDAGEYAASFEHYARGNARQRATLRYDPEATTAIVQRSMAVYTASFFADHRGWGSSRNDPIFIVGLPRSGSTLVEQILASHSQVEGTRELPHIPAIARELTVRPNPSERQAYPLPLTALEPAEVEAFATRYLSQTQAHRSRAKPHFVDKMLNNFAHLGLIQLMFPQAAIIDVRRHPLGCGFSCYKQLFAHGLAHTYDLTELGRYYRDYADLMAHVDAVLPGRVHRVYYEQLVADPATEVRRLLEHCGLTFEPECLNFHENRRVVQTISSEQVRRPIYTDSVAQWRHYAKWLGPLEAALGEWVERYTAASGHLP
jgi:tetratricopeptide (TPR) repeat protein